MGLALGGQRVLVVEDEAVLGMLIEDVLELAGATVVGPATRVPQALAMASNEPLDLAVLDVNLHGEMVFPVARALRERNVRFIFATGYSDALGHPEFNGVPVLVKPYTGSALVEALAVLLLADPAIDS